MQLWTLLKNVRLLQLMRLAHGAILPEIQTSRKTSIRKRQTCFSRCSRKASDPLISATEQRDDAEIYVVDISNRDNLSQNLVKQALKILC